MKRPRILPLTSLQTLNKSLNHCRTQFHSLNETAFFKNHDYWFVGLSLNLPLILALPFIILDLDFTFLCVICKMEPLRRFNDTMCAKHKMYIKPPPPQN